MTSIETTEIKSDALIPGVPDQAAVRLLKSLTQHPRVAVIWLYGSRAMGRHRPGSDIDLCLDGEGITHSDRLTLMAQIDDLLLPWQVDLSLRRELPAELLAHINRVGRCLWQQQ